MGTKQTNYNSTTFNDSFQHTGLCPGTNKPIIQTLTIDDGTGKLFQYELQKDLTWKEYTIEPDFTTNPIEPTILDNTEIIPDIVDPYNVVENDGVDYDFSNDGTQLNKQESETINQVLSTPRNQTVKQDVRYFTGWEIKVDTIIKDIAKTNIAPEACNTLEETGICSPKHIFRSCSTDLEDTNPQNINIDWSLYIDNNSNVVYNDETQEKEIILGETEDWSNIHTLYNNPIFQYIYQVEGRYKLIEIATDSDNDSSTAERIYNVFFDECGIIDDSGNAALTGSGSIEIEKGKWQIIAMPLENMYWDIVSHNFKFNNNIRSTFSNCVVAQLEDRYNKPVKDLFRIANAYIGDIDKFYNYIPGFTKDTSEHNFPLIYIDEDDNVGNNKIKKEIVGFWIKALDMDFTINWEIK